MPTPIVQCCKLEFINYGPQDMFDSSTLSQKDNTDLNSVHRISQDDLRIRVLLPSGLVRIQDDSSWVKALHTISEAEWMDNEMKIIIEI